MTQQILEFKKTNHFLYSQWDRGIGDPTLYKILPYVERTRYEKEIVIVYAPFLKKRAISKDSETCLILILKFNLIITAYWCDSPNYLYLKEKNAHFQTIK